APGVTITQSDGSTRLAEGPHGATTGLGYDTYDVALTRDPGSETVTITIQPEATETLHQPDGDAGYRFVPQVWVGTSATTAMPSCLATWISSGGDFPDTCDLSIELTFDTSNWDTAQTVYVFAIGDSFVDGSDLQAFADSAQRVHLIQGPLFVDGYIDEGADRSIPDPVLLPGEFSGPLPVPSSPSFDAIEDRQVDTLIVHNEDSISDDIGNLTATRLTGLGMAGDQFAGGRPLPGGITYEAFEVLEIYLGSGADAFTVESTHVGTTLIDGGNGADTFDIRTIDGHTNVRGGGGGDTFRVGTDVPVLGGLVDEIDALLVIDSGPGVDNIAVDDSGEADDNLGTLTQTTLTGLDMVSEASDRIYSLTIGATTTRIEFTITVPSVVTPFIIELDVADLDAATLQEQLQALLHPVPTQTPSDPRPDTGCGELGVTGRLNTDCAQSVWVWQHDGDLLIGFHGELAGLDVGFAVESVGGGTATDVLRMDGINYYGLAGDEDLTILLGSGDDRFNVRGTIASTRLETRSGDDVVYVSDTADLGELAAAMAAADRDLAVLNEAILHGTVTVDDLTFHGSLDLIAGALDIETGMGSNTLAVSDHADTDADTAVTITDASITGLAPATITYAATAGDLAGQGKWTLLHDAGLFGRGITIYGGEGGNKFTITSVLGSDETPTPFAATVTTLFAGAGSDTVNVSVADGVARRLVIRGEDGDDTVNGAPAALTESGLALVIFGDDGYDTLTGGSNDDQIFGDDGRVHYLLPTSAAGWDIVFGGDPSAADLVHPLTGTILTADTDFLTPEALLTVATTVG
ncbi:MAG: hypothetical protein U9R51_06850, partial [Actinomycetota bacterium]|nr:hypothetical protein [Actinomycetota bacterium]